VLSWPSIALLGFALGVRHATDPDHVIAVATIVARERSVAGAVLVGALWGLGHTLTIAAVGGAIVVFGLVISPRLGLATELSVALMLIALGIRNLGRSGSGDHSHLHAHADYVHDHPHGHAPGAHGHEEVETPLARLDRCFRRLGAYHTLRPVVVGIVHGLAGSAAVALLVLTAVPGALAEIVYLVVFGVGTIAGMMLVTAVNALPFAYTAGRFTQANRMLGAAAGLASVGFGLFLVYRIGFVHRLFGVAPLWTPG